MRKEVLRGRFTDAGRMRSGTRDTGEMARRTRIATFVGSNVTAIRNPDTGSLEVHRLDEQGKPVKIAEFPGEAFFSELAEVSGEGEGATELTVYHAGSDVIPTAVIDRRPVKDVSARPAVKVSNLVRAPAKAATRDMARHKDTSPIVAMQARNEALRSNWHREVRR